MSSPGAASLLACLLVFAGVATVPAGTPASWEHVVRWLHVQRDAMSRDLETAHATLLARAEADGETELVARLSPNPPRPRPTGYGILPEIDDDEPPKPLKPHQTSYSLKTLGIDHAPNFRDAALLAGRVTAEPELPLAPWVAEFERLRRRMRNLEDHLDYHVKWQNAVVMYGPFFAARNRIVDRVRELRRLQEENGSSERIAELQQRILTDLSPFRPTSGLHVETRTGGERVLPVRLHTDITDVAFLELFRDAVESEFSRSEAARSRRFAGGQLKSGSRDQASLR